MPALLGVECGFDSRGGLHPEHGTPSLSFRPSDEPAEVHQASFLRASDLPSFWVFSFHVNHAWTRFKVEGLNIRGLSAEGWRQNDPTGEAFVLRSWANRDVGDHLPDNKKEML